MFCPKCSQPQPPEDLRFCPRCGFPVGTVREMISRSEAPGDDPRAGDGARLPAQKEVTTGALLMFAGGVAAVLWGFTGTRWPPEVLLPQSYFILGLTLVFVLTLFHPLLGALERVFPGRDAPRRRDGIDLGALLMFAGTLKAMLLTSLTPPGPERGLTTLLIMAGMLLLLLLLRPLLRAAHRLFFRGEGRADAEAHDASDARLDPAPRGSALPPARAIPVNGFAAPGADTGEMAAPPSVAEGTTRKLSDI